MSIHTKAYIAVLGTAVEFSRHQQDLIKKFPGETFVIVTGALNLKGRSFKGFTTLPGWYNLEGLTNDVISDLESRIEAYKKATSTSHNTEYPRYIGDFLGLARQIGEGELILAEKEFLIQLIQALKAKELAQSTKLARSETLLADIYEVLSVPHHPKTRTPEDHASIKALADQIHKHFN